MRRIGRRRPPRSPPAAGSATPSTSTATGRRSSSSSNGADRRATPARSSTSAGAEAEVYRALRPLGVPVPNVGRRQTGDVLLVDRMPGSGWFQMPRDRRRGRSIARDFIGHLATWHGIPARGSTCRASARSAPSASTERDQVAAIRADRTPDASRSIDPLAWLLLDDLEQDSPTTTATRCCLQGDTGPGNLLHHGGRVSAVLDWELAHVGDPMDDIAWLSWRATQHGFPDFPERIREYEAASGHVVDPARVAYYRVNALARLGPLFGTADMESGATFGVALAGILAASVPMPPSIATPTAAGR